MRKVYGSNDFALVGHLRQVLQDHRIDCLIRNEHLVGGAGELPPTACWPELWILDERQLERAEELVRAMLAVDMEPATPWRCPGCGEPIEGQFSSCWRCGRNRSFAD